MSAASVVDTVFQGLSASPPLLAAAVLVVVLTGLVTLWLIMSRRYAFSYKTAKSHIELKPADPANEKTKSTTRGRSS